MKPSLLDAYRLLHDGTLAMAELESNGIRIHEEKLEAAIKLVDQKLADAENELKSDEIWSMWIRKVKTPSIGSRSQLRTVLKHMGHKFNERTRKDNEKADDSTLRKLKIPFVDKWLDWDHMRTKVRNTYLGGIKRETVNGYIHPFFNLNTAVTYRSSSDQINFQNIFRDGWAGELIRSLFIPRPGRYLVENDFGSLEFNVAACFWRDKAMIEYASDPTKDVHRDQAMDCYMLDQDEVTKDSRYAAKNKFVFRTLYGGYYKHSSKDLWDIIPEMNLKTKSGVPLKKHLASKGITKLGKCHPDQPAVKGTYEYYIKEVEERFMGRFPEFAQRKEDWYKKYRQRGWFDMMTGFRCRGLYRKNDFLNYGIQGPGFHCELWTIIRLLRKLKKAKMKSLVVGQVHDCSLGDVPKPELQDYLNMVKHIVAVELPAHWDWIIVPMKIEAEVSDKDWWSKKVWVEKNGKWGPKE